MIWVTSIHSTESYNWECSQLIIHAVGGDGDPHIGAETGSAVFLLYSLKIATYTVLPTGSG